MRTVLRTAWIWLGSILIILVAFPLLALVRLFDRDPVRRRTGRFFRRIGVLMTRLHPGWSFEVTGYEVENPQNPYVLVSNHQSFADIPFISRLPWEMKWMAKSELFQIPVAGWMMRMAGDIPIKRGSLSSSRRALERAAWYLERNCSVIIFPEGTRSQTGELLRFTRGAFKLAIETGVPLLPMALTGTRETLPRGSLTVGPPGRIRLHIFEPIETEDLEPEDVDTLKERVRSQIGDQLEQMRSGAGDLEDERAADDGRDPVRNAHKVGNGGEVAS